MKYWKTNILKYWFFWWAYKCVLSQKWNIDSIWKTHFVLFMTKNVKIFFFLTNGQIVFSLFIRLISRDFSSSFPTPVYITYNIRSTSESWGRWEEATTASITVSQLKLVLNTVHGGWSEPTPEEELRDEDTDDEQCKVM